jgi:hypothetical protein
MKYFHFIPAACIFLFCQCGGQDSHFLSDTKYIPVFSEDSCQYIDHGDNLHFTGAYSDASLSYLWRKGLRRVVLPKPGFR